MKMTLLTVGKTDVKWVREGLGLYSSRLRHYVPFSLQEMPELKGVSALTQAQIKEKEGKLILAAISFSLSAEPTDSRTKFMPVPTGRFPCQG